VKTYEIKKAELAKNRLGVLGVLAVKPEIASWRLNLYA
jgi:hypothetical protein